MRGRNGLTLYLIIPSPDTELGKQIVSCLILLQTDKYSDGVHERIFQKVDFEKKSADDKNHANILNHTSNAKSNWTLNITYILVHSL